MITIILCILLLIDLICIGREAFGIATLLTLATLGGIWVFSHNPFSWMLGHLPIVGYSIIAYGIIGFFYSLFKYKKFLTKKKDEIIKDAPGWEEAWINNKNRYYSPSKMKGDILGWIFWWPLSIVGYLVSDFIYDFINKIWKSIGGFFKKIFDEV